MDRLQRANELRHLIRSCPAGASDWYAFTYIGTRPNDIVQSEIYEFQQAMEIMDDKDYTIFCRGKLLAALNEVLIEVINE